MPQDFDILSFAGLSEDHPYVLDNPVPTDLRVVINVSSMPSSEDICKAIANVVNESIDTSSIETEDDSILWATQVRIEALATDFLMWVEPLSKTIQDELNIDTGWVVALQTVLHPSDPLTHFANLMRMLGGMAFDVVSICDLPTGRWFPIDVVKTMFIEDEVEPPEEVLWITRLVEAPEDEEPENRWAWISTHGLLRCGKAELEMMGVPSVLCTEAIQMIDGIAALVFESNLPMEGQSFSIGSDLSVSILGIDQAVARLHDEMPGNEKRTFPSAVIASNDQDHLCPIIVLEQLRSTNTAIAKSLRSTNRRASLANRGWELLLTAAHRIGKSEHATCMVQIPFSHAENEDTPHEYLWFSIEEVHGNEIKAKLAHQPMYVTSIPEGHQETFKPEDVTDWVIMTPVGPLGPSDTEAIELFLTQI